MINPCDVGLLIETNTIISSVSSGALAVILSPLPAMNPNNVHVFFLTAHLTHWNGTQTLGFRKQDFNYVTSPLFQKTYSQEHLVISANLSTFRDNNLTISRIRTSDNVPLLTLLNKTSLTPTVCQPYTNPGAAFDLTKRTIVNDLVEPYKWLKL